MSKLKGPPPIVAVSTSTRDQNGMVQHWCGQSYLNAIVDVSEAVPLLVPSMGEKLDLDWILARVDGLMLTGGIANVHPPLYGKEADERSQPFDLARDSTTLPLVRAAVRAGIPILGICRGIQEMNVALGGSLIGEIQDLPGRSDHRGLTHEDRDVRYAIRQNVHLNPGSQFGEIIGASTIQTNTLHRQAIDRLADGLVVEGTADDGTIEVVRIEGCAFAYGVQWHPEYWAATDPVSNRLFRAFGDAMRARMPARLAAAE